MNLRKSLAVSVLLLIAACSTPMDQPPARFILQDHNGDLLAAKPYDDKLSLIFFGYTYCPDICPTGLQVFAQAMEILGDDADKTQPIFVTIDPERDSVPVMAEYVSAFYDNLVGVTGSEEEIEALALVYEAEFSKAYYKDEDEPTGLNYMMNHTGWIYLVGPGGFMTPEADLVELWAHGITPEELAAGLKQFIPN